MTAVSLKICWLQPCYSLSACVYFHAVLLCLTCKAFMHVSGYSYFSYVHQTVFEGYISSANYIIMHTYYSYSHPITQVLMSFLLQSLFILQEICHLLSVREVKLQCQMVAVLILVMKSYMYYVTGFGKTHDLRTKINIEKCVIQLFKVKCVS